MLPAKFLTDVCHWYPSIALDEYTGGFIGMKVGLIATKASILADMYFWMLSITPFHEAIKVRKRLLSSKCSSGGPRKLHVSLQHQRACNGMSGRRTFLQGESATASSELSMVAEPRPSMANR